MDAAKLQSKVYAGYAKAAKRVGYATAHYRPASADNPIAAGNRLPDLFASFNAEDMGYRKPNKYGHPTWFGLLDGRLTQVGDYLINAQDGTFFIAAQQTALPILLVRCNRTLDVLRVSMDRGVGQVGYGGDTPAAEQMLMAGWPASVLQGTKGEQNDVKLPGDVRLPWWAILLPVVTGIVLRTSDIISDDLGRRYIVSSAELTDLGWRITAMQVQA